MGTGICDKLRPVGIYLTGNGNIQVVPSFTEGCNTNTVEVLISRRTPIMGGTKITNSNSEAVNRVTRPRAFSAAEKRAINAQVLAESAPKRGKKEDT